MSSDARKRAEKALLYNRTHANSPRVRAALVEALEALLAAGPAKGAVDPEDSATWRTADGSMLVRDLVSQVMGLHPGADRLAVELAAYGAAKPRKSYATAEAPIAREHPKGEECTHYGADDGDCLTNACSGCCVTYRETLATSEAEVARLAALLSAQPAPEPAPPARSLEALIADVERWQAATFPNSTPRKVALHILKEAKELADAPTDTEEIADVFLLTVAAAFKNGVRLIDIASAKFKKVQEREWGEPDADGVVEHVRAEPAPPDGDAVREAAEALEPIDTIKVACGTADKADVAQRIGRARVALDAALRAAASPAPGSEGVREAEEANDDCEVPGVCRACTPLVNEEISRWQARIEEVITRAGLVPYDASGNESGDPLDYSADQIEVALGASAALRGGQKGGE